MIIFCSFDDVFCKLSFIVGSNWYYPYSMRQLLGEVVINILCHYHHQGLTASYLLESHVWLDSDPKKQLWNIYTLEII